MRSAILVDPLPTGLWRGAFVASYALVGTYTWWRRPESRVGPLLMGAALLYSLVSLNAFDHPLAFTLGMTFWVANVVVQGYVYLCFPRGRLESRLERRFVLGLASATSLAWGAILVVSPTLPAAGVFNDCGTRCPDNGLQVVAGSADLALALATGFNVVFTIGLLGLGMLIFTKSRSSPHLLRRALKPLAVVFLLMLTQFVVALFVAGAYPEARATFKVITGVLSIAIPAAILVGQVRGNVFAAVSLGQVAVRAGGRAMTPTAVQRVIGDALGDPSLTLALPDSTTGGYVDVEGEPIELPRDQRSRGVTRVTRNGRPLAALIHDPALDTQSDVVEGLAATSLMLLENARLIEELRASRARIVQAADAERVRLERDLHDGAQQRLVALQIRLGMARELVRDPALGEQLEAISEDAQAAIDELRAVAHGRHLGALEDSGPVAALRTLADRSVIPIEVVDEGVGRLPRPVETALFYCAREAIQNATKHAGPHAKVTVRLSRDAQGVALAVTDDGVGLPPGAASGSGIVGIRDRIEAIGGRLELISARGQGTTVHATMPDGPALNGTEPLPLAVARAGI